MATLNIQRHTFRETELHHLSKATRTTLTRLFRVGSLAGGGSGPGWRGESSQAACPTSLLHNFSDCSVHYYNETSVMKGMGA